MGEPVGKRHRRIRARSATGQVAGAANEKPGLEAHRPKTACPTCVLQKAPRPSRPNLSPPPDTTGAPGRAVSCPEKSGGLWIGPSERYEGKALLGAYWIYGQIAGELLKHFELGDPDDFHRRFMDMAEFRG
jgi:hypothetical protein